MAVVSRARVLTACCTGAAADLCLPQASREQEQNRLEEQAAAAKLKAEQEAQEAEHVRT